MTIWGLAIGIWVVVAMQAIGLVALEARSARRVREVRNACHRLLERQRKLFAAHSAAMRGFL